MALRSWKIADDSTSTGPIYFTNNWEAWKYDTQNDFLTQYYMGALYGTPVTCDIHALAYLDFLSSVNNLGLTKPSRTTRAGLLWFAPVIDVATLVVLPSSVPLFPADITRPEQQTQWSGHVEYVTGYAVTDDASGLDVPASAIDYGYRTVGAYSEGVLISQTGGVVNTGASGKRYLVQKYNRTRPTGYPQSTFGHLEIDFSVNYRDDPPSFLDVYPECDLGPPPGPPTDNTTARFILPGGGDIPNGVTPIVTPSDKSTRALHPLYNHTHPLPQPAWDNLRGNK